MNLTGIEFSKKGYALKKTAHLSTMECFIVSVKDPSYALTIRGKGNPIVISKWNKSDSQKFKIKKKTIKSKDNKLIFDVCGGDKQGNKVIQFDDNDSSNQKFVFCADGTIRSPSGLCFDIEGGKMSDGTPICMWSCHGGDNQQWRIVTQGI